ncbi:MAG: TerC/Alx family metal homeostasis membrane protein [Bacteroidales bacterium]
MIEFINHYLFFSVFFVVVLGALLIDLLLVGRNKHVISLKESLALTAIWMGLAIAFFFFIRYYGDHIHRMTNIHELKAFVQVYSPHIVINTNDFQEALEIYRKGAAMDYLAGYFLEYSLSLDNIFVILMILTSFSVDPKNYKTVLFWGILGAIVLRFIFIFAGSALVTRFDWLLYLFGAFLVYSGIKMYLERNKDENIDVQKHPLVQFLSRHINVHPNYIDGHFWKRMNGKLFFTPLFIVLVMIEFTDLIFAFDSIPAIFSITRDPYIVFFSNIFAIIGLRSLFFLLSRIVQYFHYLKVGIAFLLCFVGFKLVFHHYLDDIGFTSLYSLMIILATLGISILASVIFPVKKENA